MARFYLASSCSSERTSETFLRRHAPANSTTFFFIDSSRQMGTDDFHDEWKQLAHQRASSLFVSPSHALSPSIDETVRAQLAGVLSPMGDFSHTMTVRQLADLHAYLRSVK